MQAGRGSSVDQSARQDKAAHVGADNLLDGRSGVRALVATRVVILVPWRTDNGHRARLWGTCKARWAALFPEWHIYEGRSPDGPWNRAAAVNDAARQAGDWDIALVCDADVVLPRSQVVAAVETATRTGRVTWAHRGWAELFPEATERLLTRPAAAQVPEIAFEPSDIRKQTQISWSCCMAVPRAVWDALGGFDERFKGWGGEDTAFAAAVQGLHGYERIEGVVTNLWHPRSPGDGQESTSREYVNNMRLRNRYAVALRRDHHMHDRDEPPASEGKRVQDLHNYDVSEKRYASIAASMGLPDWSDWWPTLYELVTGIPVPEVALIVHTGGAPEAWTSRSAYLRASLASLNERLSLPRWERRVIWSDWGDRFRQELESIAAEYGFYLPPNATPSERQGYTESMNAEWAYIDTYVKADWVFRTEDDFTLDRDVDVIAMVKALDSRPQIVQMALLRQAISERERKSNTILGYPCDTFDKRDGWLEHQHFFTCNPSLIRRSLCALALDATRRWPSGQHSEAVYGRSLFAAGMSSALWGSGEQWITHLGEVRAGGPY